MNKMKVVSMIISVLLMIISTTVVNVNVAVASSIIGSSVGNTDIPAYTYPVASGYISVNTVPINGNVFVDGILIGNGKIGMNINVGTHSISFGGVSEYIIPASMTVNVNEGQTVYDTGVYVLPVPTPVPTPYVNAYPVATSAPISTPAGLYSFDNIQVDHTIKLCDVTSDDQRAITGGSIDQNCGKTVFDLSSHPLDVLPSGGNSGKISASEMVYVDVVTSGSMSVLPWRTQTVIMNWYDGSDNRLIYSGTEEANNIDNHAASLIGRFSWEINKPGKYYVDVTVVNWGTERLVFDVVDNGGPSPVETYEIQTPSHVVTPVMTPYVSPYVEPTPVVTYTTTPVVTYTANPTPAVAASSPDPGCWSGAVGFGMCAGDIVTRTGIGFILGIGEGISKIIG